LALLIGVCLLLALSCGLKMAPQPRDAHMPGVPSPAPEDVEQGFAIFTPKPSENADPFGLGPEMGLYPVGQTPVKKKPGEKATPTPTPTPKSDIVESTPEDED